MKWLPISAFTLASMIRIIYFGEPEGFYSDSAIRYRYAEMFSTGRPIPEVDKKILHPEGLKVVELIHLTMDWLVGTSHRFIKGFLKIDLISYIKLFISIFSSLSIIAVFLIAKRYVKEKTPLIILTFLYAVGIAGFWRIIGNYLREEFVLPIYLFAIYAFLRAFRQINYAFLSGILFSLALASWHLSQFTYLVFLGYIIIYYLLFADKTELMFRILVRMTIPIIITSFLSPTLSSRLFFISIPMIITYLLILLPILAQRFKIRPQFLLPLLLIAPLPILFLGKIGEYSHVIQLIISKVRFLGSKPDNPNLIPIEARLIWFGPFSSPGPYSLLIAFGLTPILGLIAIPKLINRRPLNIMILYLMIVYLFCYLLIIRLEIFLFPFLVIAIGILIGEVKRRLPRYLIILLILPEFIKTPFYPTVYQRYRGQLSKEWESKIGAYGDEFDRIIQWFQHNTKGDDAVLGYIDVSAMILSRSGNPIVLEPIYELKKARERVWRYLGSLYEDERLISSIMKKEHVRYLLYDKNFLLDETKSSLRYILAINQVGRNSAIFKMHFFPDSLRNLSLRYQTLSFRIFALDGEKTKVKGIYSPYFDPGNFDISGRYFRDQNGVKRIDQELVRIMSVYNRGVTSLVKNKPDLAIAAFEEVSQRIPGFERSYLYLAVAYHRVGRIKDALASLDKAFRTEVVTPDHFRLLGSILRRYPSEKSIPIFRYYVGLIDRSPIPHLWLGYFLASVGKLHEAKKEFLRAKELDPENRDINTAIDKVDRDLSGLKSPF